MLLRIGTRFSTLSRKQTELVVESLKTVEENLEVEIIPIITKADQILDKTLHQIGGKGLFLKELEYALLENKIDIAVHSLKDVPGKIEDNFIIASVLERGDPRDVLISKEKFLLDNFSDIPKYHSIATSSVRRKLIIQNLRPDIEVKFIRGSVERRLERLICENFDSLILSRVVLDRLDLDAKDLNYYNLAIEEFLPSAGQGTIAIEVLKNNVEIINLCKKINNLSSWYLSLAERSFLKILGANCSDPVAAYAQYKGDKISAKYMIFSKKFNKIIYHTEIGEIFEAESIGESAAQKLLMNL
ncbi:MAG: hydroxymethylbilane synthase [Rickettsia sp.]|nr:hydroxymethylbilane synthase [Rickettsia sp.]